MIIRAPLDQKTSLNAIWCEYLDTRVPFSNTKYSAKTNTNVGHALLNARYYDSQRGQFLSQDPVFWEVGQSDDGKRVVTNPQPMNSYSYAGDNPTINKDPSGRIFGIDDLAEIGLIEIAVPIIRAGIVTGAVNTDFQIGSNVFQNIGKGQLGYDATPGALTGDFAQGFAFGVAGESGAGLLSPFAKGLTTSARAAKMVSQGISASGVSVGADLLNGNNDPYKIIPDASIAGLSTFGASRIVGIPRGSDVKSFSSPLFLNGVNMSNAARAGVASQGIQSFATTVLSSIVVSLQNVVSTLQTQHSKSK